VTTWYANAPLKEIQDKDRMKVEMMAKHGRTLIVVPCWWDKTTESLIATIREHRPDLLLEYANCGFEPISHSYPDTFFTHTDIPDVGRLMAAGFYTPNHHFTNWWIGEKYDGMRAFWNSNNSNLYSRQGRVLNYLEALYRNFPPFFLDGELWAGRKNFDYIWRMHKYERQEPISTSIRFIVFDSLSLLTPQNAYEKRYSDVLLAVPSSHPFIFTAFRFLCDNHKSMPKISLKVISEGGEGVIIRKPFSRYEHEKSKNLLKMKSVVDADALVVDIKNSMYICKLPNDVLVESIKGRGVVVQKGDVVTLGLLSNRKVARDNSVPKITRVRCDLLWPDVVHNYHI